MFERAGFTMLHNFCCRGNYKLGIYGVKFKNDSVELGFNQSKFTAFLNN